MLGLALSPLVGLVGSSESGVLLDESVFVSAMMILAWMIDWSHSLVTSVIWSALFGSLFVQFGRRVMWVMAAAVFSHFVLDFVMHPADLALWPGSNIHLGLGLWRSLPTGWWFVELCLVVALLGYYWRRSKTDGSFGGRSVGAVVTVLILHTLNSPWFSAL